MKYACIVRGRPPDRPYFVKIGLAHAEPSGRIRIKLDALPVDGELWLLEPRDLDGVKREGGGDAP